MKIGIVTRSFPEMDNAGAASRMAETGFQVTELCLIQTDSKYWVYNGTSDISGLSGQRVLEVADIYRSRGIEVHALGVFTNLIDPDPARLDHNLDYFIKHMEFAQAAGIPAVSTECGFDPASRGVRADVYESRYGTLLESLKRLCDAAEKYHVRLALEPCVLDVVPSAKRMADTIRQVGSPALKVLLDPANLIANSSEKDMFAYLNPHIDYFHGKDRKVNDAYGRNIGEGDINWPLFLSLAHRYQEDTPFIIEYPRANNCAEILARVKAFDLESMHIHAEV
jgi:sugar phosphate isomerase/epimerase